MDLPDLIEISYFPGCSLATTAKESNQSLVQACETIGLNLIELDDWNCCGTSSAKSLDRDLGLELCARNLAMVPGDRPLLTMCPSCFKNLLGAQVKLREDPDLRRKMEQKWGGEIPPERQIITFLEILHMLRRLEAMGAGSRFAMGKPLKGLKVAPYYGCMSMFPPKLRRSPALRGEMEKVLSNLGAEVVPWMHKDRCCGTYLAAIKPEVATPLVTEINRDAKDSGADCMVTACAMCQLNVEIRCKMKDPLPILHFSEVMALALGSKGYPKWFTRHLVDPTQLLKARGIIA